MTRLLAAVLLAFLLGCQGPPAPPPRASDPTADALAAFERRDWVPAARLLREAIVRDPKNLTLHYYLAIAATHLDLREEAVREFQWVVSNGLAGSDEVEAARRWLIAAGVLRPPTTETAEAQNPPDEMTGNSGLRGQVTWDENDSSVTTSRLQLFLKGLPNSPTDELMYVLRTDETGRYEFKRIKPGPYKLTNRIAGQPVWRLRVEVPADQELALDLTPANSVRVRDDFPQNAR